MSDIEQAALILTWGIMVSITAVFSVIALIIINNIFSKFWKPIKWVKYEYKAVELGYCEQTGEYVNIQPRTREDVL
jgi:hypothetical protein